VTSCGKNAEIASCSSFECVTDRRTDKQNGHSVAIIFHIVLSP